MRRHAASGDLPHLLLTSSQNQRCGCAQLHSHTRSIDIGANEQNGKPQERDIFCKVRDAFSVFARKSSEVLGTAWAFIIAIAVIVMWALTGHVFHYSDTWQLIINTGTTIVTFLMVFLIQNTQNRDAKAVHLKLDELIRS